MFQILKLVMSKYACLFLFTTFTLSAVAQCRYNSIMYERDSKMLYLETTPITLDIYETPFNGRLIEAILKRNGNRYTIEFEITRDSSTQNLKPSCFEKGDRVSLSLSDNSIVGLTKTDEKMCGVKFINEDNGFVSVTDYMKVVLTQDSYEKLKKHEVVLMKFFSKDFDKTIVLKSELEQIINDKVKITNPNRFFLDNIECLTNPDF